MQPTPIAETVVLVEGESDRQAVLVAGKLLSRDLNDIEIVAMGGATNIAAYVSRYDREPGVLTVVGLCDQAEQRLFTDQLPAENIFVCRADLEDELIRAAGVNAMIDFIDSQGEIKPFRTLQKQPAQRGRSVEQHLHRFFGTRATRKIRYASALTAALGVDRMPPPLVALLRHL